MIARVARAVRIVLSTEKLPEDPSPPPGDRGRSFFKWLFEPERLPRPAVSVAPDRTSFWRWLFMPEPLPPPAASSSGDGRKSLLPFLFARETLPLDPSPVREKSSRASAGGGRGGLAGDTRQGKDHSDQDT